MSDLFLKLMKYTGEKEDFFTECLAAALQEDRDLARQFLIRLCGSQVNGINVSTATIHLATQVPFPNCRVDMVFSLNENLPIGVENKLRSPEGRSDEGSQLEKYLRLPLARLAFVTGHYVRVSKSVRENPRYVKPPNARDHFLWSDFYDLVEDTTRSPACTVLNHALLSLFKHLGFDPPHPSIGDLHAPDLKVKKQNRRNFAKLWDPTRNRLRERGWQRITTGSIAELVLHKGKSKKLGRAWLDPLWAPGSLRIRLTPLKGTHPSDMAAAIESVNLPSNDTIRTRDECVPRKGGKVPVLDVFIPMRSLFEGATESEAMARRIAEFVLPVIDAVS